MRAVLPLLFAPALAQAQAVQDCAQVPWIALPSNLVEPWADHSRSFAQGAIRVAALDTGGEPVCCAAHLLVLSPEGGESEPEFRSCRVISATPDGSGFFAVDVAGIASRYDPARGLLLSVPVSHWTEAVETGGDPILERIEVRINQADRSVTVE